MHSNEPFIAPQKTAAEIQQELDMQEVLYEEVEIESHVLKRKITRKYVKKNEPKERLECDVCGRIFSNHRSLQNHIDIHMNNYKYICDVCGEKYATSTGILKHACLNKKRKRPEVDYRLYDVRHCKYCGLIFENFEANQRHKCEYQFEEDPKSFKCRFCDGVMSKHSYNKHMARHLATDDDLTCEYCGKKLADKTSLAIHITTHTGDRPFKCSQEGCTQSFINKNLLNRHLRFHGIEIETFSCTICNKTVASKYHLKFHMKTHKSLVECQLCKKEFESREKLREHYQNDHEPYSCQYCSKKFALPRYLKMHEATHVQTTDKPFKCDYCNNKSFTKIALLMNHMLKLHSDDFEEWKKSNEMLFHMKPADVL
jgi:KRAB domain-containing zinc finger protein